MKNIRLLLLLLVMGWAMRSSAIDASLSFATFKGIDQHYIEVYLHIAGKSVTFVPVNDSLGQAGVEVLLVFKKGEEIVKFDKFQLNSPVTPRILDFIDLKRYSLADGNYQLLVSVKDVNNAENAKEYSTQCTIAFDGDALMQSDIQLLAEVHKDEGNGVFVKNGLYMEPLPYNFYGKYASTLSFYCEVYNADKAIAEDYAVSYFIEQPGEQGANAKIMTIGHKRQKPAALTPVLMQMDISSLPSGNYNLVVEVRNKTKQMLSRKSLFFQRSNPYLNAKQIDLSGVNIADEFVSRLDKKALNYSLRAITPLLPPNDVEVVNLMLKNDSLNAQRMYLLSYWLQQSPTAPQLAYEKFMEVAAAVDKMFHSGFRYGFETDRGYVYIKYGQPNDIERRETEPSAPPYEIWSYNEIKQTRQNNVRFVFYNPSLAAEDFILLHSDVVGEINNPQWMRELYRDAPNEIDGNYFDGTGVRENINRNAGRVIRDN